MLQKILKIAPNLLAVLVLLPILFIDRSVPSQYITGTDLALMLPLVYHFGVMLLLAKLSDGTGIYTAEERRAMKLAVVGALALVAFGWAAVVSTGGIPTNIVIGTAAGLLYALYDLWLLVARIRSSDQLARIVLVQIILPMLAGMAVFYLSYTLTKWQNVLNPVAVFFMLRSVIASAVQARDLQA